MKSQGNGFAPQLAAWPLADRTVLALLRVALGTEPPGSQWPIELDPATFRASVGRHRVGAFLHERLGRFAPSLIPTASYDCLREAARITGTHALLRSAELINVATLFHTAGIPFMSVKGPLLAQALYGNVGGRHAGDIDLLVPSSELAKADAILRNTGWRRTEPDFDLTPRQWREYQRLVHEFEYVNDRTQMRLEIAWRLEGMGEQSIDELLVMAKTERFGGVPIARLPSEVEFVYLFSHGARHAWFRLFWLVDIALLFLRREMDWPALMSVARERRVELSVWQGAVLAETVFHIPIPAAARVPAGQTARGNQLAATALGLMVAHVAQRPSTVDLFRQAGYLWQLRPGWKSKVAIVRPRLNSPDGWKMLRLPDQWFVLYYFVAPWLWLRRRMRRTP